VLENSPERASGIGSWPGTDVLEIARTMFGELQDPSIPYLPELPGRGPGSDLIGRGAALLIETPVDLQPSGWRLVSRPGRDLHRAQAMLRQDLDVLAEVADGYRGPLKVQVCGPWTLAASVNLPRLERAVADPGACRDLTSSLAEGLSVHLAEVQRSVPGAEIVLQLDEPSLPAVLLGRLPTSSGFGRLRSVDDQVAVESLRTVLEAATEAGAVETLVHCCSADVPIGLLLRAGADGLSVDVSMLGVAGWEELAPELESDTRLWAGAVPTSGSLPTAAAVTDAVWTPWRRLGLSLSLLDAVILTPACGLSGLSPTAARNTLKRAVQAAEELAHRAQD
jgi:methionine synthase II (cobalamin-independent)